MKELCANNYYLNRYLDEQDKLDQRSKYEESLIEERLSEPATDDDVYETCEALTCGDVQAISFTQMMANAYNAKDWTELGRLLAAAMDDNRRQRAEAWAAEQEPEQPDHHEE